VCGLAGILTSRPEAAADLTRQLRRMTDAIVHRGPDDSGTWVDETGHCALGFRRLSIVDLSPNGHQPMISPSGRYTVTFNGEIYNHLEFRAELERLGYRFRGHSDTETICAAFEEWGVRRSVTRFIGMFAIAVWDGDNNSLSLVRDRLGIKPLYVYRSGGLLLYGSELKALKAHPGFAADLDEGALQTFLRYLYIPAPATVFRQVVKVMPGHVATVSPDALELKSEAYWSLSNVYARGREQSFEGTATEAVDELEQLLINAVSIRKQADVPLGALLSGGIDSTTVVAMMQANATTPTRTFSIGFDSAEHDESKYAARIAKHLGTDHTSMIVDGKESLAIIPQLPFLFDEPFADPSQIPTYLVSRMARRDVTVALSGDGADEVFAGYHRYIDGTRAIARSRRVPQPMRLAGSAALRRLSNEWYPAVKPFFKASEQRLPQQKLAKLARLLGTARSPEAMYQSLLSAWQEPGQAFLHRGDSDDAVMRAFLETAGAPLLDRMMLTDQATYLPDDLLAKVDRASMAVSLEARVPLIDHRVIEFAWRLPAQFKVAEGRGKWILREVLYRHVPKQLVDRPKTGFTVPIDQWLRGPLRGWAESNLASAAEPLDRVAIRQAWQRFQKGEPTLGLPLWAVLMLQSWRAAWEY